MATIATPRKVDQLLRPRRGTRYRIRAKFYARPIEDIVTINGIGRLMKTFDNVAWFFQWETPHPRLAAFYGIQPSEIESIEEVATLTPEPSEVT